MSRIKSQKTYDYAEADIDVQGKSSCDVTQNSSRGVFAWGQNSRMRRKMFAGLAVASALALGLSACSGSTAKNDGKGKGSGTVKVIAHNSFTLPDDVIKKFEKTSGYTVKKVTPGDAGAVVNQLVLANGKPEADVVFGVDTFTAGRALKGNIAVEYETSKNHGKEAVLEKKFTPIDRGDVCVNYDKKWFEEKGIKTPETLEDLAKPEYAKLLVVENPAQSSPGYAFLAATVHELGDAKYEEYWKKLIAGGTRVAGGWNDAYYTDFSGSKGKGKYPLVVSYSSSPSAENGATGVLPKTCVKQVEYAGVLRGAENPEGAKAFVDFLLSEDVQKAVAPSMYIYPVTDVKLPDEWVKYAPKVDSPISIDPKTVGEKGDTWLKNWRSAAGM
ncbi:thiamine ABC transporter substrate-binding protein [Actinotignum urinale]|uniref:thiamine ABC transporter substrate-binding protein n=1 Tax=Actinotignum urinale TaxID=190146 RepID=UPI00280BACB6|nr:thiamine ABC transporter substrate-binding protein [Actinotignum urinale]